jgi:formate hydrogenlyase subunit 6/NADH:ubiquinone oxidoreductase subunit I
MSKAPSNLKSKVAVAANAKFVVQVSPLDCTGCDSCARTCPVNKITKEGEQKTLQMTPLRSVVMEQEKN